jgi:hypothetical protein
MVVQQTSWKNLKTKTEFVVATWTAGKILSLVIVIYRDSNSSFFYNII